MRGLTMFNLGTRIHLEYTVDEIDDLDREIERLKGEALTIDQRLRALKTNGEVSPGERDRLIERKAANHDRRAELRPQLQVLRRKAGYAAINEGRRRLVEAMVAGERVDAEGLLRLTSSLLERQLNLGFIRDEVDIQLVGMVRQYFRGERL